MKFRKKPVVIEARQFDGTQASAEQLRDWIGAGTRWWRITPAPWPGIKTLDPFIRLDVPTLEGTLAALAGDWIIRGVKGEFYPCKPDIFAATYEIAESEA